MIERYLPHNIDVLPPDVLVVFDDEELAVDSYVLLKPYMVYLPSGENEDLLLGVVPTLAEGSDGWEIELTVVQYYTPEALAAIEEPRTQTIDFEDSRKFEKYWREEAWDPYLADSEEFTELVNQISLRYKMAGEDEIGKIEKDLLDKIVLGILHKNWELQDIDIISQN